MNNFFKQLKMLFAPSWHLRMENGRRRRQQEVILPSDVMTRLTSRCTKQMAHIGSKGGGSGSVIHFQQVRKSTWLINLQHTLGAPATMDKWCRGWHLGLAVVTPWRQLLRRPSFDSPSFSVLTTLLSTHLLGLFLPFIINRSRERLT